MKTRVLLLTAILWLSPTLLYADLGNSADNGKPVSIPDGVMRLVEGEQYDRAVEALERFVEKEKFNADAWNWLGYSQRNTGDLDAALISYDNALRIDPQHIGANEYLGELYVMQGEMDKAKEQLRRLAEYCNQCEEYGELEMAIQQAGG